MALRTVGKYRHGNSQSDLREEITCYSEYIGSVAQQFADAVCRCGGKVFRLLLDDDEGVAIRQCPACSTEHPIGDSDEYLDGAELGECACPCDAEEFEITVGVSLYEDGEDVYCEVDPNVETTRPRFYVMVWVVSFQRGLTGVGSL